VEVHRPDAVALAAQDPPEPAHHAEQRGRREEHHAVVARPGEHAHEGARVVGGVVGDAARVALAAERRAADAAHRDAVALLGGSAVASRGRVPPAAGEHAHRVAPRRQVLREVAEDLPRGGHVGRVVLVDE
jgi:hypothetical protein